MATVYVTIGATSIPNSALHPVDVFEGVGCRSEVITSSGTSATGALSADGRQVAQIVCATDIYVTAEPTATATNGVYVPGGIPTYLSLTNGKSVSVIDV